MKPATIILIILLFLAFGAGVDASEKISAKDTLLQFDEAPKPISGLSVEYPKSAKQDGIEGSVLISAYIDSDGSVSDISVIEGVREDLDKAAVQAVKQSRWIAAKKDNIPIGVKITVPIQFKLQDKKDK